MSIVALSDLLFEIIIEEAVLQSQLSIALDGGFYLVLIKFGQRIESHDFAFEIVLCVGELWAELSQFTSIAKHQFIFILGAIVYFLTISLWIYKGDYVCGCLTNCF